MRRWVYVLAGLMVGSLTVSGVLAAPAAEPCSRAWYEAVDALLVSGDGRGHGPDLGSDEWRSVMEFKLGVRGAADMPARDTPAWCRYIDARIRALPPRR